MALPILERKLPVDSYTDFRHPQQTEQQACLMACCSPAALSTLSFDFGQQGPQQHHQPDTFSFPPAVCALPQEQQRHHQQQQQQQQQQPQGLLQDHQHGSPLLSPTPACSSSDAGGAYMRPALSSSHQQARSQTIWPSPPLGPGDIQSSISYHDSPVCGTAHLPYYTTSPASPGGWSSESASGYPPNSTALFEPPVFSSRPLRRVRPQQDMTSTPCTPGFGAESDVDISAGLLMSVASPEVMPSAVAAPSPWMTPNFAVSSVRPRMSVRSPTYPKMSLKNRPIEGRQQQRRRREDAEFLKSMRATPKPTPAPVPAPTSVPVEGVTIPAEPASRMESARVVAVAHEEKTDEPYAKLIYRALMSRPDYTMTLQELYQWFRDNTTKAKNEKGGWQNSIRHNLSMNGAFERRDRKRANGSELSACAEKAAALGGETKRANEWVLAEAAIGKGVQSTTRYRKGNSGRRSSRRSASTSQPTGDLVGRGSSSSNSHQRSSIKALSGQKGGCAARNARVRSHMYGQGLSLADGRQYRLIESGLGSPPPSSMPDAYYSMPIAIPRIDTMAAAAHGHGHGHDFVGAADAAAAAAASDFFGLQMTASGPHGGGGNGDVSVSYMGHHHQPQEEPLYAPQFPYRIADVQVQLDYSGEDGSADVAAQLRRYEALTGTPRVAWASPHGI
ncbi:hypothetical protein TgHK011_009627 [Trichoderma gracile]|nr:hypothetical protein TgHK011_009627 [Trichoderma gracile]